MIIEMTQPQINVVNCNLHVQEVDEKEDEDSFEADDNEDIEETHKIKTKTQMNLKVKTDMLISFAKNNLK